MRLHLRCIPLLLLAALFACSGAEMLNATVPRDGYALQRDIPYGPLPRHRLDIYTPARRAPSGAVVVFFYGGSWQMGSRDMYRFVGQALASRGYTVVIPDYRVYPEVRFPAFLEDGARAVAWVDGHIAAHGANPENIFLAGHSAGAYNAVMLALNDQYLQQQACDACRVRGVVGLAGPYVFLPFTDPKIIDIFSTAPAPATQPVTFAGPGRPPLLLLHGDADKDVLLRNSRRLAARLEAHGSPVELNIYPGVGHYGIILSLSGLFRSKTPALDEMDAFISRHSQ